AKAHWGRANGWMFMGIAELLTRLPKDHKSQKLHF
ncbi:MAG: glycoside hydrolase family 88 protein, partial [Phaeodactylibacter sp.]|nr:glycoside hydrolase family 88 protein [Phaeodactylibacter sp.]